MQKYSKFWFIVSWVAAVSIFVFDLAIGESLMNALIWGGVQLVIYNTWNVLVFVERRQAKQAAERRRIGALYEQAFAGEFPLKDPETAALDRLFKEGLDDNWLAIEDLDKKILDAGGETSVLVPRETYQQLLRGEEERKRLSKRLVASEIKLRGAQDRLDAHHAERVDWDAKDRQWKRINAINAKQEAEKAAQRAEPTTRVYVRVGNLIMLLDRDFVRGLGLLDSNYRSTGRTYLIAADQEITYDGNTVLGPYPTPMVVQLADKLWTPPKDDPWKATRR